MIGTLLLYIAALPATVDSNLFDHDQRIWDLSRWGVQAHHGTIQRIAKDSLHQNTLLFHVKDTPLRTDVSYGYYRAEVTSQKFVYGNNSDGAEGSTLWYSWKFLIPTMPQWKGYKRHVSTTLILGQFHGWGTGACSSPTICLELRGNNLSLAGKEYYKDPDCHWNANLFDSTHVVKPQTWYQVVLKIHWSKDPAQGWIVGKYRPENTSDWTYFQEKGDTLIRKQTLSNPKADQEQAYLKFGAYFNEGFIRWMKDEGLPFWDIWYADPVISRNPIP